MSWGWDPENPSILELTVGIVQAFLQRFRSRNELEMCGSKQGYLPTSALPSPIGGGGSVWKVDQLEPCPAYVRGGLKVQLQQEPKNASSVKAVMLPLHHVI